MRGARREAHGSWVWGAKMEESEGERDGRCMDGDGAGEGRWREAQIKSISNAPSPDLTDAFEGYFKARNW